MKKIRALLNIEFLIQNDALKNWRMILFLSLLALIMIAWAWKDPHLNFPPPESLVDGATPISLFFRYIEIIEGATSTVVKKG